jgi:mono/diheme cytochrome c family protein
VLVEAKGTDREYTVRTLAGERKQTWRYPSRTECMVCHTRASNYVLGLTTLQMNKVHDYGGVRENQLRTLERLGVLRMDWAPEARNALKEDAKKKGMAEKDAAAWIQKRTATRLQRQPVKSSLLPKSPDRFPKLVDPYDATQDLEARARSYLHANCAICHVEAGGGNAMMELEFTTARDKMRTIDVPPNHHTFEFKDARLIAPGHPERSTLLHRLSIRGPNQMPPLATSQVDREAVKLLEAWIRQLKPPTPASDD